MSDRPNRRGSRSGGPTRTKSDLADVVELLLDKGIVINADIAVSVGDAELLGIQLRAAIASFETAAKYGLEFPTGTDTDRIEEIAGATAIDEERRGDDKDDGIDRSQMGEQFMGLHDPPISSSSPAMRSAPISGPQYEEGEESEDAGDREEIEDEGGLSGAIDQAGEAISGTEAADESGPAPGTRARPMATDDTSEAANESETDMEDENSEPSADTEADAAGDDADTEGATENGENENEEEDEQ
jgi:hypothetical protein